MITCLDKFVIEGVKMFRQVQQKLLAYLFFLKSHTFFNPELKFCGAIFAEDTRTRDYTNRVVHSFHPSINTFENSIFFFFAR